MSDREDRVIAGREIRACAVCGIFYPADPAELRRTIDSLLSEAKSVNVSGEIRGLIVPHAGYEYSGFTAAHAYSLLRGRSYRKVIVLSPSHRDFFRGISTYPGDAYSTPLGVIEIDKDLRAMALEKIPDLVLSYQGHGDEHAIEIQLPFLQRVLDDFTILPLVIGDQTKEVCLGLGNQLGPLVDRETLVVASTDLSHFHSASRARILDGVALKDLNEFNYAGFMEHLESGQTEACGGGPTVAAMATLAEAGATTMKVLHACNSGDVSGDIDRVVGYVAAVALN